MCHESDELYTECNKMQLLNDGIILREREARGDKTRVKYNGRENKEEQRRKERDTE